MTSYSHTYHTRILRTSASLDTTIPTTPPDTTVKFGLIRFLPISSLRLAHATPHSFPAQNRHGRCGAPIKHAQHQTSRNPTLVTQLNALALSQRRALTVRSCSLRHAGICARGSAFIFNIFGAKGNLSRRINSASARCDQVAQLHQPPREP